MYLAGLAHYDAVVRCVESITLVIEAYSMDFS